MSNDLNQCQFIGRLGKEPEVRQLQSGDSVCNFSLAVGWKSKDKEGVEWVNITVFGKLADICGKYLKKGSQVFVSGKFKTDKYTDNNGVERYSTKIMANEVQFLGGKPNSQESHAAPAVTTDDDDIPF